MLVCHRGYSKETSDLKLRPGPTLGEIHLRPGLLPKKHAALVDEVELRQDPGPDLEELLGLRSFFCILCFFILRSPSRPLVRFNHF